jgi:deoxyribodipyrimidine photo-lyase
MSPSLPAAPALRVRAANERPWRSKGDHVLYWTTSARRGAYNFALQHAAARAQHFGVPLLMLEALRCDYRWASARLHRFVLDGMRDNARWFAERGIAYLPYVESERGAGKGLLAALSQRACGVVTDDFPCFFLPRMLAAAAAKCAARVEAIDSNGLLPLQAAPEAFPTAYAFRRFLHRNLAPHLAVFPLADALAGAKLVEGAFPADVLAKWPAASRALLEGDAAELAKLPIDAVVGPAARRGGARAALAGLHDFFDRKLVDYSEQRNQPEPEMTSRLSPYLHFGHVSVHEVFAELAQREEWTPARLGAKAHGKREGWWNMSAPAEGFLDELVTWRELGYVFCARRPDYDRYESLPAFALDTLEKHARDPRPHVYTLAEFEAAHTHDPLWNAAQRQLVREGGIHNYLRMLWGKKILEWSAAPRDALDVMVELNNRYALDGRNPNSYSGIFWTLGRFDRPWPERKVFGAVRCMTSESTAKKLDLAPYLAKFGAY